MPRELPAPVEFHWIKECKGPQDNVPEGHSPGKNVTSQVYQIDNKPQVIINCNNLEKNGRCKISSQKDQCIFSSKEEQQIIEKPEDKLRGGKSIFPKYR